MVRKHQTSGVPLHIGESRDSQMRNCASWFDAEPVSRPAKGRTVGIAPE